MPFRRTESTQFTFKRKHTDSGKICLNRRKDMVCRMADDEPVKAPIVEDLGTFRKLDHTIDLYPHRTLASIYQEVRDLVHYDLLQVVLSIQVCPANSTISLNDTKDIVLRDLGLDFGNTLNTYKLVIASNAAEDVPTSSRCKRANVPAIMPPPKNSSALPSSSANADQNYVGLVNQAMTCYLNSLLQALFMTPEFRNALYNWEFDGSNPDNSIPFQLQRLFLNLQTSPKTAVETTDLTHSFGWNVHHTWMQHDIQELCRVMFDALEQKFKDTKQADLINELYEGKMLDYVMCLDCHTEKSREDTFLDIPLPVRPFGSTVAYSSVEEALRAFVQPEILDGNNQYFCEKCNKKCNAHKGLKFTKFPYLLTLHLKRFDFDYNTINRIKLNDKVVFPEILNLNSFILDAEVHDDVLEEREAIVKCDDCSTTDSGSALDDDTCQGPDSTTTTNGQDDNCAEEDEGIDVSSGSTNQHENEKNRLNNMQGPHVYELFSIMIHSGSASGGHYYAYIKDFSKNQWFCFNDQSVTPITSEDICRTYGGGPQRAYYSGAYSSSTNAYMLMYRQIDKQRNCEPLPVVEFPPHITTLLRNMRDKEELDKRRKEENNDNTIVKVHCNHPEKHVLEEKNVLALASTTIGEVMYDAREKFRLQEAVKSRDCRLVAFSNGIIEESFDSEMPMAAILKNYKHFLLEIKAPEANFVEYKLGGVMMKSYIISLDTEEVEGPFSVWVNPGTTTSDLQQLFRSRYQLDEPHIVQETFSNEPHYLNDPAALVKFTSKCNGCKLYVSNALDMAETTNNSFGMSKLASIIDRFVNVVALNVSMPDVNDNSVDLLTIPSLDSNHAIERLDAGSGDPSSLRMSPLPSSGSEAFGDQSTSEDSSLSDGDRTLVGDAPGDNLGLLSSSSNSPADQNMEEDFHGFHQQKQEDMHWDDIESPKIAPASYYFKAHSVQPKADESGRTCKVLVDKRMTLGTLKKHLEPIVGIAREYFKIYRMYPAHEQEWTTSKDKLSSLKDDDFIVIKLGRVLRDNEYAVKVYHLQLKQPDTSAYLFDWVVTKEQLVSVAKAEILMQAKRLQLIDLASNKCRLRKRAHKNPARIFFDDETFGDLSVPSDIYVQEIEGERKPTEICVFVRRWNPDTMTLDAFVEVNLEKRTMDELKAVLAQISSIPVEFVEVANIQHVFPCDANVLEIHNTYTWNCEETNLASYPFSVTEDGSVFFYRDSRIALKKLSREESRELNQSENHRLGRSESTYTRRREYDLKIYVDKSPKKDDELYVDY